MGTAVVPQQVDLREAYARMRTLREFEQRIEKLSLGGRIIGSVHLGIGQEAVSVGARLGTLAGDLVLPTYRGHNQALAWGMPVEAAFAEILGRETGSNRGRGGSKHLADASRGVLPGNALVAAALPIACGTALRAKLDGDPQVSLVFFGEGSSNQAAFHESLNLAAVWALPVLFVCENNLYAEMTPIGDTLAIRDVADRASSYGMPGVVVDGMDVEAVAETVREAADRARGGGGPTLVEAKTYRFCGHMPTDTGGYRSAEELERWRARDPLTLARDRLVERGVAPHALDEIDERVRAGLREAERAAFAAPAPDPDDIARGAAPFMEAAR